MISRLAKDAHLVGLRSSGRSFVTDRALKAERAVITMMKAGIGEGAALARESAVATHLADAGLTEGQADAVRRILLTPDRIVGVQGRQRQDDDAGPCPRTCRERPVMYLAPSPATARVLGREIGMATETLQWFLVRSQSVEAASGIRKPQAEDAPVHAKPGGILPLYAMKFDSCGDGIHRHVDWTACRIRNNLELRWRAGCGVGLERANRLLKRFREISTDCNRPGCHRITSNHA